MEFQTGHIGLNVSDIERSSKFYRDVFGLDILGESRQDGRRYAFLGKGQNVVFTLWQQSEGRFSAKIPGLHHISFQVESVERVRETEARLKKLNVCFLYEGIVPHAEHAGSGGVYFEDPDGIRLEIFTASGLDPALPAPSEGPSCGFF